MNTVKPEQKLLIGYGLGEQQWFVALSEELEDGAADAEPVFILPLPDDPSQPLPEARMTEISLAFRQLFAVITREPVRGEVVTRQPEVKTRAQLKRERKERRPH